MKNTVSYAVKITKEYKAFKDTIQIYRNCVQYLLNIVLLEYDNIVSMNKKKQCNYLEHCVHTTDDNEAIYKGFDERFYKIPCYFRRAAISDAIGIVKSYKAGIQKWQDEGCEGKKPFFGINRAVMPCFFKKNMFKMNNDNSCQIKLFINNDWVWRTFSLSHSDLNYIYRYFDLEQGSAPVIEKVNKRYRIRFTFESHTDLPEQVQSVCAVDLGINTDAVCSIVQRDGTVTARKFINSPVEKDRMYTILNQIKKAQANGNRRMHKLWRFVNNYNREISIKTARQIVQFAKEQNADCIVFEYLDTTGKKKGRKKSSQKQKMHMWRKRDVQKRVEAMAHRLGIRFSHVAAKYTSKLAYDGSGPVVRNKNNHSLCEFVSGKQYNCDLSASYNIGARYFIRERLKPLSESKRLDVEAKVPSCAKRTLSTLSTLISLDAVLSA